MAIKRMISTDPEEFRRFQTRMIRLGNIRTGIFETPPGKKGRPAKLDRFRFTSPDRDLIDAVAVEYGGTVEEFKPQGAGTPGWQVTTDADRIPVYIINGQKIDPTYEAWSAGRRCIRRCDGEWDTVSAEPCVCNGLNLDKPRPAPRDMCKPTTRVNLMLPAIEGIGSWLYESHGENFAIENGGVLATFVASAPVAVPAWFCLEAETRQHRKPEGGFEKRDFYVARFRITAITPEQIALGGDMVTRILTEAGSPAALSSGPALAIEGAPVSAVPVSAPTAARPAPATVPDIEALRPRILADIEAQTTLEGLDAIREKLVARGISDQRVKDAWNSKMAALKAAAEVGRPYRVLVTGSRTWTDTATLNEALDLAWLTHKDRMVLVHGACPQGADALADTWAEVKGVPVERYPADWNGPDGKAAGFKRNQTMVDTRPDIVLSFNRGASKGTEHCTAAAEAARLKVLRYTDDTPVEREAPERQPVGMPLKEYQVGDKVTVGGIEFTKISDNPFPPGSDAAAILDQVNDQFAADLDAAVSGVVEDTPGRVALPDVPAGDYDADELYTMLMTGASQQVPPLTTSEVNSLISKTFGVHHTHATGHQLARLRAGLKSGAVSWR